MPRIPTGLTWVYNGRHDWRHDGRHDGPADDGVTAGRLTTGVTAVALRRVLRAASHRRRGPHRAPRASVLVNVRDNTKFVETFDNSKIVDVFRPRGHWSSDKARGRAPSFLSARRWTSR
jgi:hypothetical protein